MRMSREQIKKRALREGRFTSPEQGAVIDTALTGKNILVDACRGSGKTYTLRLLFAKMETKNILYLTYNNLLKLEAQATIPSREGSFVTNYHSFVYHYLTKAGLKYTNERGIQSFIRACNSGVIELPVYDVLLVDEYQDITDDIADLLECIKKHMPTIQIIAVGDMSQKIHDYTPIDVLKFIDGFIGERVDLALTKCFRLPSEYAAQLGRCWGKTIEGVNKDCTIEVVSYEKAIELALNHEPEDILVLGALKSSSRSGIQNSLERLDRRKYNKHTLYSSIKDTGDGGASVKGMAHAAIFTSYDRCKGMERDICFVCDFTEHYWNIRSVRTRYHILRNLFLVAASRGKKHIYFVRPKNGRLKDTHKTKLASEELIGTPYYGKVQTKVTISDMFHHIDVAAIRKCLDLITVTPLETTDTSIIPSVLSDGYIDLSPCIGVYAGAVYFETYPKEKLMQLLRKSKVFRNNKVVKDDLKIAVLCWASAQFRQTRYKYKVYKDYLPDSSVKLVKSRLAERLPPDAETEIPSNLHLNGEVVLGFCDVMYQDIPYELKFVRGLSDAHFLQCACYVVALNKPYGVLWNMRDNTCYKVEIPDLAKFKESVYESVFKRHEFVDKE